MTKGSGERPTGYKEFLLGKVNLTEVIYKFRDQNFTLFRFNETSF